LKKSDEVICASIGAQIKASRKFRQYTRFISWPHTQRGFRTLAHPMTLLPRRFRSSIWDSRNDISRFSSWP
jgi:hypothetical protein